MNKNNQFSIDLQDGWEDNTIFTYKGPADSGVQHNLIIVVDKEIPPKIDVATYAYQQIGSSKQQLPGFEQLKEGEKVLEDGSEGFEVIYKFKPTDKTVVYQKQLFVIIEGQAYSFTSSYSKKTLKTIANDVDQMINTFIPTIYEA